MGEFKDPTIAMLDYFDAEGFEGEAAVVAQRYYEMAEFLVERIEASPEKTVAMRKLLESRDSALRDF